MVLLRKAQLDPKVASSHANNDENHENNFFKTTAKNNCFVVLKCTLYTVPCTYRLELKN